jgi:predicted lipoprotein with Yx(FWY)xxD motif
MFKQKQLSLISIMLFIVLALSACGGAQTEPAAPAQTAAESAPPTAEETVPVEADTETTEAEEPAHEEMAAEETPHENDTNTTAIALGGNDELGEFLVGPNGLTLYTFANDAQGVTNCYGDCAVKWPPLLIEDDAELAADSNIPGEFGTVSRTDGGEQITYIGLPLYYWFNDAAPGDATGHGVKNVWAVARAATKVSLGGNDELGKFLIGDNGLTLYTFANDVQGVTNCYDDCAVKWPPLLVEDGESLFGGAGVTSELGTVERTDGGVHVTYDGLPLYYWFNDANPGDATGHGVKDVWAVARTATKVSLGGNDELGKFLVGDNGLTLYTFTNDAPGVTNCYDDCAVNWPPLLLEDGDMLFGGAGVIGKLDTVERTDGGIQVTYNDLPLYYWVNDASPGDATGHGVKDVWFVASP